jgi:hypothetical protein
MTLDQRVVRLERQNLWMKRVGVTVLAFVALLALAGQDVDDAYPKSLVADTLLVNDIMAKRIALTEGAWSPLYTLATDNKTIRGSWRADAGGASLSLFNDDNEASTTLGTRGEESFFYLGMSLKRKAAQFSLQSQPEQCAFSLNDKYGTITLDIDSDGPALEIRGKPPGSAFFKAP